MGDDICTENRGVRGRGSGQGRGREKGKRRPLTHSPGSPGAPGPPGPMWWSPVGCVTMTALSRSEPRPPSPGSGSEAPRLVAFSVPKGPRETLGPLSWR